MSAIIEKTAIVSPEATIGDGTHIWHGAQVREGAVIGQDCIIGKGAYIDAGVRIGDRCKIENYACIYAPAVLESGVFVGPHAVLCNDRYPRAVNPDGTLKGSGDWQPEKVYVCEGASIGAGAIILPDVRIGKWAVVGAGAVVTRTVLEHELAYGNPARVSPIDRRCKCGRGLHYERGEDGVFSHARACIYCSSKEVAP